MGTDFIGVTLLRASADVSLDADSQPLLAKTLKDGKIIIVDNLLRIRQVPDPDAFQADSYVFAEILEGRHRGKKAYFDRRYLEAIR